MSNIRELIKKGNVSSAAATIGNIVLAAIKGIAAYLSGSGAMFAEAMHTLADTLNQGFVFLGSILAERKPTERYPTGFGRLINLFCMGAVLVVTVMAYETVLEGLHLVRHPVRATNLGLTTGVLIISILVDGYVLVKSMREILAESHTQARGLGLLPAALRNLDRASPPTRLVFFEDVVATSGALLAILAILLSHYTPLKILDGIAAVIIGLLMGTVAFRLGYDNMAGLIGVAAPREVEEKVAQLILADPDVTDINKMRIVREGRYYHVESYVELRPGLSLAEADDIKFRIRDALLADAEITDVTLGIIEDNGIQNWAAQGV